MRARGFTLIELLLVVAIIAVLAAIAVPNFLEAQVRSKVARGKADMRTMATGIDCYVVDANRYPPDIDSGIYGPFPPVGEYLTFSRLTTPVAYLSSVPADPFRVPPVPSDPKGVLYDYWGEDAVVMAAPESSPARQSWQRRNVHWILFSVGPDRRAQYLGGNLDMTFLEFYDPTNGTVSRGDYGRANTGSLPNF